MLGYTNKKQVDKTSQIVLDQVENVLSRNEQDEKDILAELKVEYVQRADAVAYVLDNNKETQLDINDFKKIATKLGVDEINLFDANGIIYAGTHPNYFGLTFESGEQIAFFKPMLADKSLTMCQDVTPNTAENKSMMYAITWNEAKTYMVQVGIEPVRLLNEMKENGIYDVVNQMTVYDGMNIYVADTSTGEILGSTDKEACGNSIYDKKILSKDDDLSVVDRKTIHLNGYRHFCNYRQYGNYVIAVVHTTEANVESYLVSILVEVLWLIIAGSVVIYILLKLVNANKKIRNQMSLLSSISDIYYSMHLIDMSDYSIEKLEGNELMDKVLEEGMKASDMLESIIKTTVEDDFIEQALVFADLTTLRIRLRNKTAVSMDVIDKNVGWLRMTFITVDADDDKMPTKVIIATQIIEEDKRREEELSTKAHKDEMTGLYNRRSYENDIMIYPDVPPEPDFVYAAIDINGLKVVNDELGHQAGDELIRGASWCMKKTLGNYGRVYRTGGDEFVSMFFADDEHLKSVLEDLEKTTIEWCGEYVSNLSISIGYVTKKEFATKTVSEMAKIADQRMYKNKSEYYSRKGIDRRGQAEANTALCNLYTKILKINLTDDSYSIVNMDIAEQTSDKGFSNKISEWLSRFGKSGQVHQDDLDEYLNKTDINFLRDYFRQDKTSISIFYRRKYTDGYKQVVLEMIPANDYADDNQSLFLYVKNIDR